MKSQAEANAIISLNCRIRQLEEEVSHANHINSQIRDENLKLKAKVMEQERLLQELNSALSDSVDA